MWYRSNSAAPLALRPAGTRPRVGGVARRPRLRDDGRAAARRRSKGKALWLPLLLRAAALRRPGRRAPSALVALSAAARRGLDPDAAVGAGAGHEGGAVCFSELAEIEEKEILNNIEIHFIDSDLEIGGFYEQLLSA